MLTNRKSVVLQKWPTRPNTLSHIVTGNDVTYAELLKFNPHLKDVMGKILNNFDDLTLEERTIYIEPEPKVDDAVSIEHTEGELHTYCDIQDCIQKAYGQNWIEWIVTHNNCKSDVYACYCNRHFRVLYTQYGKRRIDVNVLTT